jgi:putative PIN family toxin of toxin-antitoxin system
MRVVVDTNILVSFAIRPNPMFARIFDFLAERGVLLVSDETLAELVDVLRREKFRRYLPFEEAMEFVLWYRDIAETVPVTHRVAACRDPKDDKFLSLALSGRADCILAGDDDLVVMGQYGGISIYTPSAFARAFDV